MGRAAMAHSSLVRGLCAAWLFFVAVSAVHEDADTPTPLVDGELGASKAKAYAFYCTPKGEMSPEYAYNDKHCASNGKLQPCGEVWCWRHGCENRFIYVRTIPAGVYKALY